MAKFADFKLWLANLLEVFDVLRDISKLTQILPKEEK